MRKGEGGSGDQGFPGLCDMFRAALGFLTRSLTEAKSLSFWFNLSPVFSHKFLSSVTHKAHRHTPLPRELCLTCFSDPSYFFVFTKKLRCCLTSLWYLLDIYLLTGFLWSPFLKPQSLSAQSMLHKLLSEWNLFSFPTIGCISSGGRGRKLHTKPCKSLMLVLQSPSLCRQQVI